MKFIESHNPGVDAAYGFTLTGAIENGDGGTADTIGAMSALALDAARNDPGLRTVARAIVTDFGQRDWSGVSRGIYQFIRDHVVFKRDLQGREELRSPEQMILEIANLGATSGDCDENATLGVALAIAAGLPAAFVTVGRSRSLPYHHVFFAVNLRGKWVPVDPQEGRYGTIPPKARKRFLWEVTP